MQEGQAAMAARLMLQELMEERRWRVPQVAEAIGISVDIVRRWLQGKSRMQLDDMVAIAKLKGADLNEIFGLQPGSGGSTDANLDQVVERKVREALAGMIAGLATGAPVEAPAPKARGGKALPAQPPASRARNKKKPAAR